MKGIKPYDFPLNILFEDDSLLVINKISGMVTHPGDGTGSDTLVHALMNHLEDMCPVGGPDRPGLFIDWIRKPVVQSLSRKLRMLSLT